MKSLLLCTLLLGVSVGNVFASDKGNCVQLANISKSMVLMRDGGLSKEYISENHKNKTLKMGIDSDKFDMMIMSLFYSPNLRNISPDDFYKITLNGCLSN